MEHTIVVAAAASESAALQYIAPYSGCTMGEYFRDRGEDALIIYDDLTKQAWAYRQVSLLLRRPPGREAYPGDVFYLHSRLLERAARVNEKYIEEATGGEVTGRTGSLTALPIIETQAATCRRSCRPTSSRSRTARSPRERSLQRELPPRHQRRPLGLAGRGRGADRHHQEAGRRRAARARQYRELAAFAQFASDLDEATRRQLERGQRIMEVLKQPQYSPLSVAHQSMTLYAVDRGYMDDVEPGAGRRLHRCADGVHGFQPVEPARPGQRRSEVGRRGGGSSSRTRSRTSRRTTPGNRSRAKTTGNEASDTWPAPSICVGRVSRRRNPTLDTRDEQRPMSDYAALIRPTMAVDVDRTRMRAKVDGGQR